MTDIHQWRRMIPPMRARTPASAADVDDPDGITSPRKGLKPKLTMYFGQTPTPTPTTLKYEPRSNKTSWPPTGSMADARPPSPAAEGLVDAVMCQLLARPYDSLDPKFNSALLQICEAFRDAGEEKAQLHSEVARRVEEREALQRKMQRSALQWERERQNYKAEVKRLELILAKGKRGLAEVTLARRDSLIRRGTENLGSEYGETTTASLEVKERKRRGGDRAWQAQRAERRGAFSTPKDTAWLFESSAARRGQQADTPLRVSTSTASLATTATSDREQLIRDMKRNDSQQRANSIAPASPSEDSRSFSSSSNWDGHVPRACDDDSAIEAAGIDEDITGIKQIAHVLARRRHLDIDSLMPSLLGLFAAESLQTPRSSSVPRTFEARIHRSHQDLVDQASVPKNLGLRSRASGLFNRLRSQVSVAAATGTSGRRFSFELGDDESICAPNAAISYPLPDRRLRRSISMSDFVYSRSALPASQLSPVAQSPTPPPTSDPRRATRIPTPAYGSGALARRRRERDDSESSLLTAIRWSADDELQGRGSVSSPLPAGVCPARSPSPTPYGGGGLLKGMQGSRSAQRIALANKLLEHTNALRGQTQAGSGTVGNGTRAVAGADASTTSMPDVGVCLPPSKTVDCSSPRQESAMPMSTSMQ